MNAKRTTTLLLCSAIFVYLFYKESSGLNVLLMTAVLLGARFILGGLPKFNFLHSMSLAGLIISSLTVCYHNSSYSLWIYFASALSYVGIAAYPSLKSIHWALGAGFRNVLWSPHILIDKIGGGLTMSPQLRFGLQKTYITIIPILIIYLFLVIYRASNDLFDAKVHALGMKFTDMLDRLFGNLDFLWLWVLLFGLLSSSIFLFPKTIEKLVKRNSSAVNDLKRIRNVARSKWALKSFTLKDEFRSGIFLFAVLNLILLGLNISDVLTIWTGFQWDGELLKSMVHTGTYLLIVSILLSMFLVLYYFRGNLNFYQKNRPLKILCSLWLIQNSFLALSVLVRNYHYISHYNLAYKRIGVIFFVMLCLLGLALIAIKISRRKTGFYLLSRMSTAVFITLVLTAIPNWDRIIARYNIQHSDTAFVHFDYLSSLSDGTLDLLDIPIDELETMKRDQSEKFYSRSFYSGYDYLTAEGFVERIESRKDNFKDDYSKRCWKEWNYADYSTFKKLESELN